MKKLLSVIAVFTLSACGQPEASWVHPSKGQQGFINDRDLCNQRTDETQANFNERFSRCMAQQGWTLQAH